MIIQLKDMANTMSQINDLVAGEKNVAGVMFDIQDDCIKVCYTDGNKTLSNTIDAVITDSDVKGKIIFNYQLLSRIIDACKPTGSIITNEINFEFSDNNLIKVKTDKVIKMMDKEEQEFERKVSNTEQLIPWVGADAANVKAKILLRGNYDGIFDIPSEDRDCWGIVKLKDLMSRLSTENGKIVYVARKSKLGFVQNTSCVVCIPLNNSITHKIVLSTSLAKSLASVLNRLSSEYDSVYLGMMNNEIVSIVTDDNKFGLSIKNVPSNINNANQLNACISKDYTQYMLNFNREVLQSCLSGACVANASDKATISFVKNEDDTIDLVLVARNNTSSTDNRYNITSEDCVNPNGLIDSLKLNITLDMLLQAVSRANSQYIAFDIAVEANNTKMVRIAEIDIEKMVEIAEDKSISLPWNMETKIEERANILGYTTYFSVSAE